MNIRALVAKVVGEASGSAVPFSGPVAEAIMNELLGVQDEQLEILRELLSILKGVESAVQRLVDAPWRSARIYIEEAAIPGRRPEQIRQSLERAVEKLHDAIPSQPDLSPGRADARIMLAIVYTLIDDPKASRYHAEIAYREARAAAWRLTQAALKLRQDESRRESKLIRSWYDDVEWSAALLGDPEASSVQLVRDDILDIDNIPYQAAHQRSTRSDIPVRWHEGARLDFVYIAYEHALSQVRGRPRNEFEVPSLAQVLDGRRPDLTGPYVFQYERDQRMGYFTGMEE